MPSIRILIANHQPIIRSRLRELLERHADFRVVGEAANGNEAVVLAEFKHPEIVLLEVTLPHLSGIAVARTISSRGDATKTLFVATHTEEGYVTEGFKAGARGYVAGDSAPTDLERAIHVVAGGRLFLSPSICLDFLENNEHKRRFSDYEKQLWCLTAAGYDDDQISASLKVDENKIKADRQAIVAPSSLPKALADSMFGDRHALEKR